MCTARREVLIKQLVPFDQSDQYMEIQTFCLKTGNNQKSRHFNREIEFAGIRLPVKWDELITGKQVI
jgi:hypothetical protein